MRRNPGRRTRLARAAVVSCAVVLAAAAAVAASWRAGQHAAARPAADCGSAYTHALSSSTQFFRADPGALACFRTAARACRPATLHVTEMGVDTGTHDTFTIGGSRGSCQVTETSQAYSAVGGSHGPVRTVTCQRVSVTGTGVLLSCGGQDVLIPARLSAPFPA